MIPYELILIILEYLNDIDVNISFNLIKKININNFTNLIKNNKRTIVYHNDEIYVYNYIKINSVKHYRIIKIINNNYNQNEIITSIINTNIPLYNIHISTLYL